MGDSSVEEVNRAVADLYTQRDMSKADENTGPTTTSTSAGSPSPLFLTRGNVTWRVGEKQEVRFIDRTYRENNIIFVEGQHYKVNFFLETNCMVPKSKDLQPPPRPMNKAVLIPLFSTATPPPCLVVVKKEPKEEVSSTQEENTQSRPEEWLQGKKEEEKTIQAQQKLVGLKSPLIPSRAYAGWFDGKRYSCTLLQARPTSPRWIVTWDGPPDSTIKGPDGSDLPEPGGHTAWVSKVYQSSNIQNEVKEKAAVAFSSKALFAAEAEKKQPRIDAAFGGKNVNGKNENGNMENVNEKPQERSKTFDCPIGECDPRQQVGNKSTACDQCLESTHNASSQQLTLVSSVPQWDPPKQEESGTDNATESVFTCVVAKCAPVRNLSYMGACRGCILKLNRGIAEEICHECGEHKVVCTCEGGPDAGAEGWIGDDATAQNLPKPSGSLADSGLSLTETFQKRDTGKDDNDRLAIKTEMKREQVEEIGDDEDELQDMSAIMGESFDRDDSHQVVDNIETHIGVGEMYSRGKISFKVLQVKRTNILLAVTDDSGATRLVPRNECLVEQLTPTCEGSGCQLRAQRGESADIVESWGDECTVCAGDFVVKQEPTAEQEEQDVAADTSMLSTGTAAENMSGLVEEHHQTGAELDDEIIRRAQGRPRPITPPWKQDDWSGSNTNGWNSYNKQQGWNGNKNGNSYNYNSWQRNRRDLVQMMATAGAANNTGSASSTGPNPNTNVKVLFCCYFHRFGRCRKGYNCKWAHALNDIGVAHQLALMQNRATLICEREHFGGSCYHRQNGEHP